MEECKRAVNLFLNGSPVEILATKDFRKISYYFYIFKETIHGQNGSTKKLGDRKEQKEDIKNKDEICILFKKYKKI